MTFIRVAACAALMTGLLSGLPLTRPLSGAAAAQEGISFGQRADVSAPVEVTADALRVDQATGVAVFTGNVLIGQGEMRLAADRVAVTYARGGPQRIRALRATGNVTLVNGPDAAEAANADYDVESGNIVLTGDVLLTQGASVLAGERVEVNLETGTANVSGRVRSVFQPEGGE